MEENKEVKEVTTLALSVPDQARQVVVTDAETYAKAGEIIVYIKSLRKKIKDTFSPIKRKIDESKKEVLAQEKAADAPLAEAEAYLAPQIIAYDREQERIRKEEEARLREEARKAEEERRLQEALAMEAEGQKEAAAAIIEEPTFVSPVVIPRTVPKVQGLSIRKTWSFRIVNPSLIPREYLKVDEVKIGGVVRALKGQTRIPGVEVFEKEAVAGRMTA